MLMIAIALLIVTSTIVQGHVVPSRFKLEGRVVNGTDIDIIAAPYQVSVMELGEPSGGGSIISKRLVLTARHIVGVCPDLYSIQYGLSDIKNPYENEILLQDILFPPNFKVADKGDIALLVLASDIPFSAVAQPIPLASVAPAVGSPAIVTGWGRTSENSPYSSTLRQVTLQIMDRTICQEQYKAIKNITENMLCAGIVGGGKDTCQGDSGGPLVVNGELVGVVAFGEGCGRADYYGVYANVAVFNSWIQSHLERWVINPRYDKERKSCYL